MSRYYRGLDLSEEIQDMYELILQVTDLKLRDKLQIQLSNIDHALDEKGNLIKDIIKKLEDL